MYFRDTILYNWNTPFLGISPHKNWETAWPMVNRFCGDCLEPYIGHLSCYSSNT